MLYPSKLVPQMLLVARRLRHIDEQHGLRRDSSLLIGRQEVELLQPDKEDRLARDDEHDPTKEGPCNEDLSEIARSRLDVAEGKEIQAGLTTSTSCVNREQDRPRDEAADKAYHSEHFERS